MKIKKHASFLGLFFITILLIGIFIFHNVENWSYLDSTYFLVITATTIGYGDLTPQTPVGKIVTMIYSFMVVALVFYTISLITHCVFDKKFKIHFGEGHRQMVKKNKKI